jgi:hypothetical protein
MVDLKNKELIKIMWLPGEDRVLFDIKREVPINTSSELYNYLLSFVDIDKWKTLYTQKYNDWLNSDDNTIYDINNEINLVIINALIEANRTIENKLIFYWFDIDRTYNEKFTWKYCPISKEGLIPLGNNYPDINSFISPKYPLVFPR